MIAVLTGNIIDSKQFDSSLWLEGLKDLLGRWGDAPEIWEIYRGDEFQLKCPIDNAFNYFLAIKSLIKIQENLDIRIAIGIGEEQFSSPKITESNGTAYVFSGRLLKELKDSGRCLAITTPDDKVSRDLNMVFKWCSIDFDRWTSAVAEIIHHQILSCELTQEDLAKKLNVSQSSISQRMKRANLDLLKETNYYYQKKIAEL